MFIVLIRDTPANYSQRSSEKRQVPPSYSTRFCDLPVSAEFESSAVTSPHRLMMSVYKFSNRCMIPTV